MFINGALARVDMQQASCKEKFNGGQTVFNLPMYAVGVPAHAINGILVGDDPFDFEIRRLSAPNYDVGMGRLIATPSGELHAFMK